MSTPGQCNTCGQPILWTRQASNPDRWNRPLDMSSSIKAFVVIDEQTLYVDTYQNHVCSNRDATTFVNQERMANSDPIAPVERRFVPKRKKPARVEAPAAPKSKSKYTSAQLDDMAREVACPFPKCTATAPHLACIETSELLDPEGMDKNPFPSRRRMHAVRYEAAFEKNGLETADWRPEINLAFMLEHDEKWAPYRDKKVRDRVEARAKRAEFDEKVVRTTPCSKCTAARGTTCWDLKTVYLPNKRDRMHIRFPHKERREAYMAKQRDKDNS